MALSAANVVADLFAGREPAKGPSIDWTTTISFRRHILDLGLGVAEAMDTAQRRTGLGWDGALELIRRSPDAASVEERKRIYSGAGTDHLDPAEAHSLDEPFALISNRSDRAEFKAGHFVDSIADRRLIVSQRCRIDCAPSNMSPSQCRIAGRSRAESTRVYAIS
jgi:hypothetical protein